ncbi:MAG: hypothetical protein RIE85_07505 [Alcanivorax sp.]
MNIDDELKDHVQNLAKQRRLSPHWGMLDAIE